jgi:putative transposase
MQEHQITERQACEIVGIGRSVLRYQKRRPDDSELKQTLLDLAKSKPTWGLGKMVAYLKQQNQPWNHKRIRRVYCSLRLNITVKTKKRLPKREKQPLDIPGTRNQSWSMDYMRDSLMNGRPFRTLNIIDDYNREALGIEIGTSLPAGRVIQLLNSLVTMRGYPKQIRTDNGPEFVSHQLTRWAQDHQVRLVYIQPGKPVQNALIERFNRTYRGEVLDANVFINLDEARDLTDRWIQEYNTQRPHESLENLAPCQYSALYG